LFMAGHADSASGIEAVKWQAVWRHTGACFKP
jgi:hypothetical protein